MRFTIEDYPIYLLVGLLTWNFFAQTTTQSMYNLVWGGSLLKRIYVPRTIFTVAVLGNGLINYLLGLIPLALLMLIMGRPFTPALLLLPLAILLLAMFTLGIALLLSTLAVVFVDIVDIFSVLLSAWFFLTPVIYPIQVVPSQFVTLIRLNPMTIMVELFRSILYFGQIPPLPLLGAATLLAVVFLVFGWWYYTRRADELAYRL
jgi:ABC-type polysaccharide/polyol phosphate export permease